MYRYRRKAQTIDLTDWGSFDFIDTLFFDSSITRVVKIAFLWS